jgi:iron complex outermembrane receptor protein
MKKLGMTLLGIAACYYGTAQYSISGQVSDENATMLPGATVVIKNSPIGVVSDGDGKYTLKDLPEGKYTLKIGFLGYNNIEKLIDLHADVILDFQLDENVFLGQEVIVYATRANDKTPTTFSEVTKEEIALRNLGQDVPFLLRFTPSMVATSDAGAGVGYTGMRIRGSDATRINVTVNGIPVNDSESHGTFWVNMPDFASSVNNIQVQRGVGTSTNGAAAFGATISMQTSLPSEEAYAQVDNSFGSFNTRKHTVIYNTGLIKDKWSFEGRLSQIASDGYLDRASSDLKSYYLAAGYYGDKTTIKALTFAGKEVTYQAWYGSPEAKLNNYVQGIEDVIDLGGEYATEEQIDNLKNSDRRFNYYLYDNEVDNYQQDNYQLHLNHTFSSKFNVNASAHYTYGRGYFEQYRNQDDLADYGISAIVLNDTTISATDLIRRRWLENHFYGVTYSANYQNGNWITTLGGGYNYYDGDHFGEIIWAQYAGDSDIRDRYYDNYGRKGDFNIYSKTNFQLSKKLNLFADLQLRSIDYHTKGVDNDLRIIDTGGDYLFFNPKFGATYNLSQRASLYGSYAVGNREPVRTDFTDAQNGQTPKHETLRNLEVGYRVNASNFQLSANYYLMDYRNQLVPTGALNDVGSSLRANVDRSYRTGVEIEGGVQISRLLQVAGNVSFSENKIKTFDEVQYDYAFEFGAEGYEVKNEYQDTDIAFSPNVVAGGMVTLTPIEGFSVQLAGKYIGEQYLDNTSNKDRLISDYLINDLILDYKFSVKSVDQIGISVMVNNLFNVKYSSNGYTWGYLYDGFLYQQNNQYPQAGINFLAGLSLKF